MVEEFEDVSILVPGDIISIKLVDIIPADARLLDRDPLKIDPSALTGESIQFFRSDYEFAIKGGMAGFKGQISTVTILGIMLIKGLVRIEDQWDSYNSNQALGSRADLHSHYLDREEMEQPEKRLHNLRRCRNSKRKSISQVESDLSEKGFCMYYKNWVFHGEPFSAHSYMSSGKNNNLDENGVAGEIDFLNEAVYNDFDMNENGESHELPDLLDEIRNAHESGTSSECDSKNFDKLLNDAQRELYPGCKKYSLLRFIVSFLHIKVMNHVTNKAFDMMLEFLKDVLPEGEILPSSFYGAMKILFGIGLGYQKIDVCKFDCSLFWKENEKMDKCPVCKESRWKVNNGKKKKVSQKMMWYFPLKARLQRLFMSSKTTEDMRWHEEKRVKEEGIMRHPADSTAWKDFDKQYPDFAKDSRNVRLGLATDGFNPFGNMSNSYSMWPVILVPYNLPAYKFMRKEYLMLSLLIPGPRAPGKELDVFLRPVIDDLKDLFHGISTYDAYSGQNFQMRAAILWTISNFPAYGYLSGWSTSGYKACPCCLNDAASQRLRGKICFMGHRRFLNHDHPWRKQKAQFDGTIETRSKPKEFSGEHVLRHLNWLAGIFGEFGKNPVTWKKGVDKI
ncbi:uncharacterized protein [Coffea arabica]|uniref:P-type ATPase A domain-containing protein n=1 Tax=Coffea arabica TaxID=13443 RepID=A0A6P6X929_COFAR|nr:uncharacterized protein LOC113740928 [Coffea arabica]